MACFCIDMSTIDFVIILLIVVEKKALSEKKTIKHGKNSIFLKNGKTVISVEN